jgi:hypothetical protein
VSIFDFAWYPTLVDFSWGLVEVYCCVICQVPLGGDGVNIVAVFLNDIQQDAYYESHRYNLLLSKYSDNIQHLFSRPREIVGNGYKILSCSVP